MYGDKSEFTLVSVIVHSQPGTLQTQDSVLETW
jgi:hypothetical protein